MILGCNSSAASILASSIMARSRMAITATAAVGNRRGSVTDGASGQRIKIAAGVSAACTSSILIWSAAVIWPEAKDYVGQHDQRYPKSQPYSVL